MTRAPEAPPYSRSLAASAAAHAALLALLLLLPKVLGWLTSPPPPPVEIEITSPFLGDGPPKLGAPKAFTPGKPAAVNATAAPPEAVKPPPVPVKAPEPPKDWVLPGPSAKVVEVKTVPAATGSTKGEGTVTTPGGAEGGEGTAAKVGGSGEGSDEGVIGGHGHGGTPLLAFPKLLNRDEVLANLRRFYPESERRAGREADVLVMIHIGADGNVGDVDLSRSSGPAFDEAARKVGRLMRFSPAIGLDGRPVRVRLPQPIQFRLTQ
ncbi:MAG: energy transducer TonB [Elusimicrobia bacterium]|nr:energy transducer TonB [Elusimicrobiota bacterium]